MRWMVLSLVLINVMIFAWRYLESQSVSEGVAEPELPIVDVVEGAEATAEGDPKVESDLALQTITLLEELEANRVELRKPSALVGGDAGGNTTVSLVSGKSVGEHKTALALDAEFEGGEPEVSGGCYWVGPMPEEKERKHLRARLKEFKVNAQDRTLEVSGGWRYWVYLEPKANRAEAASQLAVLKKMGVDSYLILKGERKNGVSLGLFSRKGLADAKMAQMQKKGWQPNMDSFERTVNQWWVVVDMGDLQRVGDGVLSILLKNKPEMQINENKCK